VEIIHEALAGFVRRIQRIEEFDDRYTGFLRGIDKVGVQLMCGIVESAKGTSGVYQGPVVGVGCDIRHVRQSQAVRIAGARDPIILCSEIKTCRSRGQVSIIRLKICAGWVLKNAGDISVCWFKFELVVNLVRGEI
jgi:hypothetical protein